MKANILILKCITNLHVGSGDVNYNIIDNEVERDALTGYPVINSSGVKGSFRQYFTDLFGDKGDTENQENIIIKSIFGSKPVSTDMKQGKIKFLSGEMLAIPMRVSKGENPFELVTTNAAIKRFHDLRDALCIEKEIKIQGDKWQEAKSRISTLELEGKTVSGCFLMDEKVIYEMKEEDFRNVSLPVLARNQLENGVSNNLWYEEVVPHESYFYIPVIANDADEQILKDFIKQVEGKIVQFGGNATIGYGLCKISVLEQKENCKNTETGCSK